MLLMAGIPHCFLKGHIVLCGDFPSGWRTSFGFPWSVGLLVMSSRVFFCLKISLFYLNSWRMVLLMSNPNLTSLVCLFLFMSLTLSVSVCLSVFYLSFSALSMWSSTLFWNPSLLMRTQRWFVVLFPYGMSHFSQADFKLLSFVFSSLTTMYLDIVLFLSILLGITAFLESINLFLWRFFFLLFLSIPSFWDSNYIFVLFFFLHGPTSHKGFIGLLFLFFSRLDFFLLLYLPLPWLFLLSSPIAVRSIL